MKIRNHILTTAFLAMAGFALITPSAKAQTLTNYNDGDLMLGFRLSSATKDYLVDIGPISNLPTTSGTLTLGNLATDLSSAFGSTWYTNTVIPKVQWSVFGSLDGTPAFPKTFAYLYGGNATSTPLPGLIPTLAGTGQSDIETVTGSQYSNQYSTANSSVAVLETVGTTNPSSYASFQFGSNSPGNSFEVWSDTEAPVAANLYLNVMPTNANGGITAGTVTVPGYFSISSLGVVSYTSLTAVPEPATVATGALTLLVAATALYRRRTVKA